MRYFLLFLLFSLSSVLFSQSKSTISGYINDSKDGEAMIGVKVVIPSINQGTVTNTYGFYSLTVPKGNYIVEYRSGIYPTESKNIDLTKDVKLNLDLGENIKNLEEVVISAKKGENTNSTKMGQIELEMDKIKTLPAFMGEVDVIKTIQLLPGVSSVS